MAAPRGNKYATQERKQMSALDRFRENCEFQPATGCVVWTGGQTSGRGHSVPYGSFWFEGRRWFAHRWAAKHIHGLDIEGLQVDHCCDNIPWPNTLCVQHLQAVTLRENRNLVEVRKKFIYLQVGLLQYYDVYGSHPEQPPHDGVPFHTPPAWLDRSSEHGREPPF